MVEIYQPSIMFNEYLIRANTFALHFNHDIRRSPLGRNQNDSCRFSFENIAKLDELPGARDVGAHFVRIGIDDEREAFAVHRRA